jgi:hypothetical protein
MIIEGKIVNVMESWPLQLQVETQSGRYHVLLLSQTVITREGQKINPKELNTNLQVLVKGQESGENQLSMITHEIEILT